MAVGAEAFREAGPAPQASQRAEHLDLRSHGAAQIRRLHGYLLSAPEALFQEMPPDNPYLRLLTEAVKRENSAAGNKNDNEQG
jgi:hypothetical protein